MTSLKRAIGPGQMMLYGVGSMMGAGIYGLVGKAAGVLGSAMWMAFLVAMAAALLTGQMRAQATMLAFADVFLIAGLLGLAMLAGIWMLPKQQPSSGAASAAH